MMVGPFITTYWEGYSEASIKPYPLNLSPHSSELIPIAFIAPAKQDGQALATTWEFDNTFVYSKEQIKTWVNDINQRQNNQKVLFSLMDTPSTHWFPDVDIDAFAQSVAKTVYEWSLGGVDLDAESTMAQEHYTKTFIKLIKALRKAMPDKIITYTCYTQDELDTEILTATYQDIDYLNTMAYWDDLTDMQVLFEHYAELIRDPNKISIGVKAGINGDSTPLETVQKTADWLQQQGYSKMMLWSLTRDIEAITHQPKNTWLNTMVNHLSSKPIVSNDYYCQLF